MNSIEQFDLAILGSGEGTKLAAWDFASRGQRVAVVESEDIGGACPNIACLPSKNVIGTSQVAGHARRLVESGVSAEHLSVNMTGIRERKRGMVAGQVEGHFELFGKSGAELIFGTGRFVGSKTIEVALPSGTKKIEGTHTLVAAGRRPNTEELGLEKANVETSEDGYVSVNEKLETATAGIWAVGDVAGCPKFTHVGKDYHRAFRAKVLGDSRATTDRMVPYCLFLEPELARVGLGAREAMSKGSEYRLFNIPVWAVLRTQAIVETRGFMKALVAPDDTILGFTACGMNAGEVMSAGQFVMLAKQPYTAIPDAIISPPRRGGRFADALEFGTRRYTAEEWS